MRVIVTGGRGYADRAAVRAALDAVHRGRRIAVLVHGGAKGADRLAAEWAKDNGVRTEAFKADWRRFRGGAGPIRNKAMADAGADLCVAFPGGDGTEGMVGLAAERGIPVARVA